MKYKPVDVYFRLIPTNAILRVIYSKSADILKKEYPDTLFRNDGKEFNDDNFFGGFTTSIEDTNKPHYLIYLSAGTKRDTLESLVHELVHLMQKLIYDSLLDGIEGPAYLTSYLYNQINYSLGYSEPTDGFYSRMGMKREDEEK